MNSKHKTILVADDVTVIRVSEVAKRMQGKSVRELARELGVAHSNVHRALKEAGWVPTTVWKHEPAVPSPEGREGGE